MTTTPTTPQTKKMTTAQALTVLAENTKANTKAINALNATLAEPLFEREYSLQHFTQETGMPATINLGRLSLEIQKIAYLKGTDYLLLSLNGNVEDLAQTQLQQILQAREEAERRRLEWEQEAKAKAERQRQEKEAEAERQRQEKEAEAERQRITYEENKARAEELRARETPPTNDELRDLVNEDKLNMDDMIIYYPLFQEYVIKQGKLFHYLEEDGTVAERVEGVSLSDFIYSLRNP